MNGCSRPRKNKSHILSEGCPMYRISIVASLLLFLALDTPGVEANDYLVGGMFNTPRVTHYRYKQTGQITYYGSDCCPQPSCPPQGCQTAYYPPAVNTPITSAVYQPVVGGRSFVSRSNYTPYQLNQRSVSPRVTNRIPAVNVLPATRVPVAPPAAPCSTCNTPTVGR